MILLLIGEAVPNLRGVAMLVEDAEQQYGMNVSSILYNITITFRDDSISQKCN